MATLTQTSEFHAGSSFLAGFKARFMAFAERYAETRTAQAFQTVSDEQLAEWGLTRKVEAGRTVIR